MSTISRNSICPCGSQLRYKKCCGILSGKFGEKSDSKETFSDHLNSYGFYVQSLMSPHSYAVINGLPKGKGMSQQLIPPGMVLIENFISNELCEELVDQTNQSFFQKATIVNRKDSKNQQIVVENDRKTDVFDLGVFDTKIKELFMNYFSNKFESHYCDEIEWFEQPQLLRYQEGGFYHYHADSESWLRNSQKWQKTMNRDYSFLLYLNDDFEGGEIIFPNFEFHIKPKKGLFVCFPSDHRFIHKVLPTSKGIRYVIVSWAAKVGSELVGGKKPLKHEVFYTK